MGQKGRGGEFNVGRMKTEHRWLSGPRRAVGRSVCVCVSMSERNDNSSEKLISY